MQIRLLGPVELETAAGETAQLRRRDRALLGLLVLEHGRVLPIDRIVDLLWDEEPPAQPRAAVHTHVSRLRQALRRAGGDRARLHTHGEGYLLSLPPGTADAHLFKDLVDRARADPDLARRAAMLRAALDLWRGPALADAATATMRQAVCAALDEERIRALEDRIEADLSLGRHAALVAELTTLVDDHPYRERFHGQLMVALYRSGRRAEALDAYREARGVLVEELGLEPGAELRSVERSILADESAIGPARAVAPAQLPADVSDFTGRLSDLERLDSRLWADGAGTRAVAISVIAGTAGVGKTALAVHWAHRVRHRFPDGQFFLNLRGHAQVPPLPPIGALARFLSALGVPADQVPADQDQAAELYRSLLADCRALIVLDDAASADQVRPLLPGTAGCVVVVTSRDQLGGLVARDGAHRLPIGVLTAGDARHLLGRLLGVERVRAEPDAVDDLARLCAYLPLALRVAAANATLDAGDPIAAYVERLHEGSRLAGLEVGGDENAGVRVAFDLSYRAQPAPVRRLFRRLGVLPGRDVTAGVAAALAGIDTGSAERLLHVLAGAHLVERPLPGRFALHDLLRLYARERATAEDGADGIQVATARLLGWYQRTVDAAVALASPEKVRLPADETAADGPVFDDVDQAMAWLDAERANLVAAIEYAAEHGPHPAAWRLADALRGYFWLRMDAVDWRAAARAAMSAAEADGNVRACAAAQISLADVDWCQARYRPAVERYGQALELARRSGWRDGQAAILGNLGALARETGHLSQSAQHLTEALLLARKSGTVSAEAGILGNLGQIQLDLGLLPAAADTLGEALACFDKLGSRTGQTHILSDLGQVRHALGDLGAALDLLHRSVAMASETGDSPADALHHIAAVHRDAGRTDEALRYAEQALTVARESGYRRFEADALNVRGTVHLALGDHARALDDHNAALEIAAAFEGRHPVAEAHLGLAAAHQLLGRPSPALGHAREALTAARAGGFRLLEERIRARLASMEQA